MANTILLILWYMRFANYSESAVPQKMLVEVRFNDFVNNVKRFQFIWIVKWKIVILCQLQYTRNIMVISWKISLILNYFLLEADGLMYYHINADVILPSNMEAEGRHPILLHHFIFYFSVFNFYFVLSI